MIDTVHQASEPAKLAVDAISIVTWVSVLTGVVTPVLGAFAALLSVIWGGFRIYELKTVQKWLQAKGK